MDQERFMQELLFLVEEDSEGGYTAQARSGNNSIFTEADTMEDLKRNIMDALRCHFDDEMEIPNNIINDVASATGIPKKTLLEEL